MRALTGTTSGTSGATWVTAYEVDYSALATQTYASVATHTIDSMPIIVTALSASSFGIVNGEGLKLVNTGSTTIAIDPAEFVTDYSERSRYRVTLDTTGTALTNIGEILYQGLCASDFSDFALFRRENATTIYEGVWSPGYPGGTFTTTSHNTASGTIPSTRAVVGMDVYGEFGAFYHIGDVANWGEAVDAMTSRAWATLSTSARTRWGNPNTDPFLGLQRIVLAHSTTALTAVIKQMRIEVLT